MESKDNKVIERDVPLNEMTDKDRQESDEWDKQLGVWRSLENISNLDVYIKLLSNIDNVFIIRQFKIYNGVDGNRYIIKNKIGENLFYGIESNTSGSDNICICGANRAFTLTMFDKNRRSALYFHRPFRYNCCGLFPCCKQKMVVKNKSNQLIGEVKEVFSFCNLSLKLWTVFDETQLKIIGPNCKLTLSCCLDDICFDIYFKSGDRQKCGHICKKSELISGGHIFSVRFPKDISPELKTLLIGATILIDFYYFEHPFHKRKYHYLSDSPETLPPFPLVIDYKEAKQ